MLYFGAFSLLVLPVFLIVSAKLVAKNDFGKSSVGKISLIILYSVAALSLFGAAVLIYQILT